MMLMRTPWNSTTVFFARLPGLHLHQQGGQVRRSPLRAVAGLPTLGVQRLADHLQGPPLHPSAPGFPAQLSDALQGLRLSGVVSEWLHTFDASTGLPGPSTTRRQLGHQDAFLELRHGSQDLPDQLAGRITVPDGQIRCGVRRDDLGSSLGQLPENDLADHQIPR